MNAAKRKVRAEALDTMSEIQAKRFTQNEYYILRVGLEDSQYVVRKQGKEAARFSTAQACERYLSHYYASLRLLPVRSW